MRILHLFSNWKWTGPAEPALHAAAAQARRGHEVAMAMGDPGDGDRYFLQQIEARGVRLVQGMRLRRHFDLRANRADARFLGELLAREPFDVLCAHMTNDHLIAARARAQGRARLPIVRTSYEPLGPEPGLRTRWLLRSHTARLVVASAGAERAVRARFPRLADRLDVIEPAVDTERFHPTRPLPDRREELGIPPGAFAVGLVGRVQERRRFDVYLKALARLRSQVGELRAFVVGTASPEDQERIVLGPARALGLGDTVRVVGRQRGEDYVALLRAFDVHAYLVPGSDGSCRAVREGLAVGRPVVAARRGMLPEIVADGETGYVVDDRPEELAAALARLARDPELRSRMGTRAAEEARRRFGLERLGEATERVLSLAVAAAGDPAALR